MARKGEPRKTPGWPLWFRGTFGISEFHDALTYPFRCIMGRYVFKSILYKKKQSRR